MSTALLLLWNAGVIDDPRPHLFACDRQPVWTYIIRSGNTSRFKIGITVDPSERLSTLQQGNPETLTFAAVDWTCPCGERLLHAALAPFRVRGEWFEGKAVEWLAREVGFLNQLDLREALGLITDEERAEWDALEEAAA